MGSQLPLKGAQLPLFGPCLLWPRSRISATAELLFIYGVKKICRSDSDTTVLQVDADYIKKYSKTYASCIGCCEYIIVQSAHGHRLIWPYITELQLDVWEPANRVWDPGTRVWEPESRVWELASRVWELKRDVWELSSHQHPLNLTPGCQVKLNL